jgi:indolepyruvate ferredoxin oxidoreductase alpha subunit
MGMERALLTGNQAIARGFWEAGGVVASSYPGSPTVEIYESLGEYEGLQTKWAMNEKIALEIAIGGSLAGARSMVSMKHVGLNIAADPFMTFTQSRIKGGFVLVVGDDPGLSSSQNEQDSRFFARFANTALLEPSTAQEAKDFVLEAYRISEQFGTPVIIRLTSNLCHSRGIVELGDRTTPSIEGFVPDQSRYCMLPPYANRQQHFMRERLKDLRELSNRTALNSYYDAGKREWLVITQGLSYQYLRELGTGVSIYKLGMSYPLPVESIREVAKDYEHILVIEELTPLVEMALKSEGIPAVGSDFLPYTGELTSDVIRSGLQKAGVLPSTQDDMGHEKPGVPERTPMLCAGCPHRPVFHILQKAKATVIGDIGCYSLGMLEPFEILKTVISMGASLGIIQGVAMAHREAGKTIPLVATIGDGTFFHSGLAGFADLAKTRENITFVVLDNRTTAMTGGQVTPTTRDYLGDESLRGIPIIDVLRSFGVTDVAEVDQFNYAETKKAITEAMKREGLSVIIATRPCALNFKVREPHFYVDREICISCRNCIQVNCPPISMKVYQGQTKKNSYINPDMCVGCSVCSQVCPVKAIKRSAEEPSVQGVTK